MWMIGIETLRKQTLSSSQIEKLKQSMNQNSSDKLQVVFDSFSTKVVIREGFLSFSLSFSFSFSFFSFWIKKKFFFFLDASDVYTWGDGKWGKLGHGEDNDESIPRVLEALLGRNIVHIACGPKHMVAIAGFLFFCFKFFLKKFLFLKKNLSRTRRSLFMGRWERWKTWKWKRKK